MSAGQHDIIIEQGATFAFDIQVNDTDLTGYSARMKGRGNHPSATTVFSLSVGNGITISHQGNHSHLQIAMSASVTAAMAAPQCGVYDVEYENGGEVVRILEGSFYVTPEASR